MQPVHSLARSWSKDLLLSALTLLSSFYFPTVLGMHLGITITFLHFWFALAAFVVITAGRLRGVNSLYLAWVISVPLVWCLIGLWAAGHFLNFSYDGAQYHQEAIIQLQHGWNPFKQIISPDLTDSSHAQWLNSLPKFGWIVGAVPAKAFHWIESAKFLTFYTLLLVYLAAYACARNAFGLSRPWATGLGFVAAASPLSAAQLFINYPDGYSAALASVVVFCLLERLKKRTWKADVILTIALILAGLSKFTNLFLIAVTGLILIGNTGWRAGVWPAVKVFGRFVGIGLVIILVFGANPFLTNLFRYGKWTYVMPGPIWMGTGELAALGPFFTGILIVSLLLIVSTGKRHFNLLWITVVVLASSLINPYGSSASHVGFVWQMGALGFLSLAVTSRLKKSKPYVGIALVIAVMANTFPIVYRHYVEAQRETVTRKQLFENEFVTTGYVLIKGYSAGVRGYLTDRKFPFLGSPYEESLVVNQIQPVLPDYTCFAEVYRRNKTTGQWLLGEKSSEKRRLQCAQQTLLGQTYGFQKAPLFGH